MIAAILFILLNSSSLVMAQNGALDPRPPQWEGAVAGMGMLFDIENGFLNNLIQSKTIGNLLDEFNIQSFQDLASDDFLSQWNKWIFYLIGYLVCVAVGVLLAFFLPICGCCVCCFRDCSCSKCCRNGCCCCCKRSRYREDDKKWKYKRTSLSVVLGIISAILFASVVCSFIALQQLKKQVEPFGVLETVLKSIYSVDDYMQNTIQQIDTTLVGEVETTTDTIEQTLIQFPTLVTTDMGQKTGVLPLLSDFQQYVNNLPFLLGNLTVMDALRTNLQGLSSTLSTELNTPRNDLDSLLNDCIALGILACSAAHARLPFLTPATDYNGLDDLTAAITAINAALPNIVSDVNNEVQNYWDVTNTIDTSLNSSLSSFLTEIKDFETQIKGAVNDMEEVLQQFNLTTFQEQIWNLKPSFHEYGMYAYWGFFGITCLCLLIVFCYLMGLLLGLCCRAPSPKDKCCAPTSKKGSCCLLAGAGISFCFSWLFLIITIVVFATGGIIDMNLCRHITTFDASMVRLEELLQYELALGGSNFTISLRQVALDCQNNRSLYVASNVENNGLNISDVVNLEQYGIDDIIDEIRNMTITVIPSGSSIIFFSSAVNTTMQNIDTGLDMVNFSTYPAELAKGVVQLDLPQYINDLEDIITALSGRDPTLAGNIQMEVNELKNIQSTTFNDINNDRSDLQNHFDDADALLSVFDISTGVVQLSIAQDVFNAQANTVVESSLGDLADNIEQVLNLFSAAVEHIVRNDIGTCRALFDAGATTIDAACVYFLDPYNTMWFCLGWFMAFTIFAVAVANELAFVFSTPNRPRPGSAVKKNQITPAEIQYTPPPPYQMAELSYAKPPKSNSVAPFPLGVTQVPNANGTLIPPTAFDDRFEDGYKHRPLARKRQVVPYDDEDAYFRSDETAFYYDD